MTRWIIMGLGLVVVLTLGWKLNVSMADEDEYWERTHDVAAVENTRYKEECGSCHMAYPPGLLPGRSWEKMMASLDNHFGENAELDAVTVNELSQVLLKHSADANPNYRRSSKIMRDLTNDNVPLRITQLDFFRYEHREIPDRLITANSKVASLSNCNACHINAERGSFRESEIAIPGFGQWDD